MHQFIERLRGEIFFPADSGNLQVRANQLRARLQLYPTMMSAQSLLVLLFIWLMWREVSHTGLLLCGATAYMLYTADMLVWLRYRHRRKHGKGLRPCLRHLLKTR